MSKNGKCRLLHPHEQKLFCEILASGLIERSAARRLHVSEASISFTKDTVPEFKAAVEDAKKKMYTAQLEEGENILVQRIKHGTRKITTTKKNGVIVKVEEVIQHSGPADLVRYLNHRLNIVNGENKPVTDDELPTDIPDDLKAFLIQWRLKGGNVK